jgi:uncharacterized protein (TIGR02246 family)
MEPDEQAIRQVIATWMAASKAGDDAAVLECMTEDAVFLVAGHEPMRGRAGFAAAQGGAKAFDIDGTSEVVELSVSGDWAWAWTRLSVSMTPKAGGPTNRRAGYTLSIFRREGGRWRLHRDANLIAPAAP